MQVKIVFSYSPKVSSSVAFNPSEQCQNRNLPRITDKHRKCSEPPNSSYIIGFLLSYITDFAKHLSHTLLPPFCRSVVPPATDSMQRGRLRPQWPWRRWRSCWAGVFLTKTQRVAKRVPCLSHIQCKIIQCIYTSLIRTMNLCRYVCTYVYVWYHFVLHLEICFGD